MLAKQNYLILALVCQTVCQAASLASAQAVIMPNHPPGANLPKREAPQGLPGNLRRAEPLPIPVPVPVPIPVPIPNPMPGQPSPGPNPAPSPNPVPGQPAPKPEEPKPPMPKIPELKPAPVPDPEALH